MRNVNKKVRLIKLLAFFPLWGLTLFFAEMGIFQDDGSKLKDAWECAACSMSAVWGAWLIVLANEFEPKF